jgi:hypothetical protein
MQKSHFVLSWITAVVLVGLVGLLDYATGYELRLFVFYFIPIGLAAWVDHRRGGIVIATLSAIAWHLSDLYSGHLWSKEWYAYWNTGTRYLSFLAFALTVSYVSILIAQQKDNIAQLEKAMSQVRRLEGMLPICSSCKKIRDDQGYWQQIESYLMERTDAVFTHGLCPDCLDTLYPGLRDIMKEQNKTTRDV